MEGRSRNQRLETRSQKSEVRSTKYEVRKILLLTSCFLLLASAALAASLSGLNMEDFQQEKTEGIQWKNNPFVQPIDEMSVHELNLAAIVYREGDAAVLISGQVLREGDKIGLSEVVHIEKKSVVLRNENGIFSLVLKGK